MNDRAIISKSKKLSWLLRHGATSAGVKMDEAGWVRIADVLGACRLNRSQLNEIVAKNNKQRLTVRDELIRAVQGHNLETTPVTIEALEASWVKHTGTTPVFHGTHKRAREAIRETGILPMRRTHVHLAAATNSKVGKRANVSVLLAVCPMKLAELGYSIYIADNGVLLCREVPPEAIVDWG